MTSQKSCNAWNHELKKVVPHHWIIIRATVPHLVQDKHKWALTLLLWYSPEVVQASITAQCDTWLQSTSRNNDHLSLRHSTSFTELGKCNAFHTFTLKLHYFRKIVTKYYAVKGLCTAQNHKKGSKIDVAFSRWKLPIWS